MSFLSNYISKDSKKRRCIGMTIMVVAGSFLVLNNSLVQYVNMDRLSHSKTQVSPDQWLIMRCIINLLLSICFILWNKLHIYGEYKKNLLPLVSMGVAEVGVILFMYEALQRMPVGDATVLQFTAPFFTTILSFVFLKTKLRLFDILFGAVSFLGVVIIAKPNWFWPTKTSILLPKANATKDQILTTIPPSSVAVHMHYWQGALFALAAALSLSTFIVLNKVMGNKIHTLLTIFYPSVMGILIGSIAMVIRKEKFFLYEITGINWVLVVVIGFVSFIGLMLLAESLQLQDPGPAIIMRNCDVIVVFVYQYLLMHILPAFSAAIGTILIVGSSTLILLNHAFNLDQKICGDQCYKEKVEETDDEEEATAFLLKNEK